MGNTKSSARKRIKELEDELIKYPERDDQYWKDGRTQWEAQEELDKLVATHLSLEERTKSQLRHATNKGYIELLKKWLDKIKRGKCCSFILITVLIFVTIGFGINYQMNHTSSKLPKGIRSF